MIIAEPESAFEKRRAIEMRRAAIAARADPEEVEKFSSEFWREIILEVVRLNHPEALHFTALARIVVRQAGFRNRRDREAKSSQVYRVISFLMRIKLLARWRRNYIKLPESGEAHAKYMEDLKRPIILPEPNV